MTNDLINRRSMTWLALLVLATLVLAACGGGDGDAGATTEATEAPAATDAPATTEADTPDETPTSGDTSDLPDYYNNLEDSLSVVSNGGAFQEAFIKNYYEPFSEEFGVEVIPVAAGYDEQWARVIADSESGTVEWDIVNAGATGAPPSFAPYLTDLGPDCSLIPNVANAAEGSCRDDNAIVRGGGGLVLAYNTEVFGDDPPQTVGDLWDVEKYPGPRAISTNEPIYMLQIALAADGVSQEDMYPLDLERAVNKLNELRPHVDYYWESGDEAQQLWRQDNVDIAISYSGRARVLQEEGLPVGITWAGGSVDAGSLAVLEDAPNPNAAMAFIDFFFRADEDALQRALQQAADTGYDVSIPALIDILPEEEQAEHYLAEGNWENMIQQDAVWIDENREEILDTWNTWLATG